MPTISIQVCCYNAQRYLDLTIQSILAQTYRDWELILVNDGSSDGTEAIIRKYLDRGLPIIYFYQKNKGFAAARNKAVELSSGDWIAILDHDDLWYPEKLQVQSNACARFPEAKLHFSNSEWFRDSGEIIKTNVDPARFSTGLIRQGFSRLVSEGCFIDSETVLIDRRALYACGGFNEAYKYIVDYDLFLKVARACDILYYENRVLAKWRVHPGQSSQVMKETMYKEYIQLFDTTLKNGGLSTGAQKNASATLASNALKYSLLQLGKGNVHVFFATLRAHTKCSYFLRLLASKTTQLIKKLLQRASTGACRQ